MTKNEIPPIGTEVEIIYGNHLLPGVIYGTPYFFRDYWCVPFLCGNDEISDLQTLRVDFIKKIKILKVANKNVFHPIINSQLCADCSQQCGCIAGAFSHEYSHEKHVFLPVIRPQKCTGCERCLERCKRGAIKIIRIGEHNEK